MNIQAGSKDVPVRIEVVDDRTGLKATSILASDYEVILQLEREPIEEITGFTIESAGVVLFTRDFPIGGRHKITCRVKAVNPTSNPVTSSHHFTVDHSAFAGR